MENEVLVKVGIKMITDISWFDALKLRLAGGQAIREFIESRFKDSMPDSDEFIKHKVEEG